MTTGFLGRNAKNVPRVAQLQSEIEQLRRDLAEAKSKARLYEVVRTFTPRDSQVVYQRCLKTGERYDDVIEQIAVEREFAKQLAKISAPQPV